MTGKLADTVMSVRNGEQIARKYQPVVFNPSTPAQVAQRAKLKLLSQLSAVLAPSIAIPRQGAISSRNLFTKKNFDLTSFASDEASITLAQVQLTSSVVAFPDISVTRNAGSIIVTPTRTTPELDRVVYVVLAKEADNRLRYLTSLVVSKDDSPVFEGTISVSDAIPLVVYAYGIRLNSEAARVTFADLAAPTAETVAKIVVTSSLTESDITLTETRGVEVSVGA